MLEKEFYLAQLIAASINGSISDEQKVELDSWVNQSERNALRYRKCIDEHELDRKVKMYYEVDSNAILQKIKAGISEPEKVKAHAVLKLSKSIRLWPAISIAAAVALVVFSGLWFFNSNTRAVDEIHYASDAIPGKKGATLTLASGKKINLTNAGNGELAREAGVSISKTADGKLIYTIADNAAGEGVNTLSTANGETYQVKLPDGSEVWLNAASSLTYHASLNENGVRRIKLAGEAYFEVAKDKAHPFVVESGKQQVEVLGTHFNVNAYEDENVFRTTLLEGSVKLSENGAERMLTPGMQAANANGQIRLAKVDTELAVAWKNNKFIFDRLPIDEIMRMIGRWYNLDVVYEGEIPSGTFWGSVSRFENVSKALVPLEATGNVHFRIEGRTIYVRN